MLIECVKSQGCTSNKSETQANEDEWKEKNTELVEREGEFKTICENILDLPNIKVGYLAKEE